MKTKNFAALAALIICGIMFNVSNANAQKSDKVTLNIKLTPFQTITVNPTDVAEEVNLEYGSKESYNKGVTVTKKDHLTIFSTGGFEVSVKASAADFTTTTGIGTIPVSDVSVSAQQGTTKVNEGEFSPAAATGLTAGGAPLFSSSKGGRDLTYNVTYDNAIGKNDKYINYISKGKEATYTTEVTYTIVAQ